MEYVCVIGMFCNHKKLYCNFYYNIFSVSHCIMMLLEMLNFFLKLYAKFIHVYVGYALIFLITSPITANISRRNLIILQSII